ncbi:hypothetical protein FJY93_00225 [Candidatus Kaiserbacteria bacterium]|nr:hypothetical protein [Candidatus Kaiserbacteria bacterium]
MDTSHTIDFEKVMHERFAQLPPSIQAAITSADVETHLRELAKTHQLHLDQWNLLENEVMLTLLGLQQMSQLKDNIMKEVGVSDQVATELANDITQNVFQPIRDELEQLLEHPASQPDTPPSASGAAQASTPASTTPTPTPPTPDIKVARAATPSTYLSQTPSHERKTIDGDPYREQIN